MAAGGEYYIDDGEFASKAFGKLVLLHEQPAMRLALRLLGNPELAQDVVQDSFIKAFVQIRDLRDPDRFTHWLFRIVNNTAMKQLRSLRRQKDFLAIQDEGGHTDAEPAQQEQTRELAQQIQIAMTQLSPKEVRAMALIGLEDMSYAQAAAIEGCSQGALRWHVFRARKKLKHL